MRSFWKYRRTTLLNLVGLVLGVSCFVFITLYVYNDYAFDRHFKDSDRVYRVSMVWRSLADRDELNIAMTPVSLPEQISFSCPEVEAATGLSAVGPSVVQIGDKSFHEDGFYETDSSFFNVLSNRVIAGSIERARDRSSIVVTETIAKRFFGDANPLQQTIYVDSIAYTVGAVVADLPANSSVRYDALLFTLTDYSTDLCFTFFKCGRNVDVNAVRSKMNDLLAEEYGTYFSEVKSEGTYVVERLSDIHFGRPMVFDQPKGNKILLFILQTLAFLIITISFINYLNLSLAVVSDRQIESGVRKVLGAGPRHVVFQYVLEFGVVGIIALVLSTGVLALFWNSFEKMRLITNTPPINVMASVAASSLVVIFFLSLLSAMYVSSYSQSSPIVDLRQQRTFRGSRLKTNGLVVFQFTTSITLVFSAFIVMQQIDFISRRIYEMRSDRVMVIDAYDDGARLSSLVEFRNAAQELPYVKLLSMVGYHSTPTLMKNYDIFEIEANGQQKLQTFAYFEVDEKFFELLGMPLLMGRNFVETDFKNRWGAAIVNEAFIKNQGWKDAVGRKILYEGMPDKEGRIIGVVKDLGLYGLPNNADPMIFYPAAGRADKVLVRLSHVNREVISSIETLWKQRVGTPMDFTFMANYFDKAISKEKTLQWLLSLFSIFAIIIASLGLIGMINFNIMNQKREIALRKMFGASLFNLVAHTWKRYFAILTISAALSYPLGLISTRRWLESFSERGAEPIVAFLQALAVIITTMILVVCYNGIQILKANSVKWLRNE